MRALEDRVTELEARIAFLEDANQQLSDLIYAQRKQVDQHIRKMTGQIESLLATQAVDDAEDEVPPHY